MLTRHHGASDEVRDAWQAPKLFREINVVFDRFLNASQPKRSLEFEHILLYATEQWI